MMSLTSGRFISRLSTFSRSSPSSRGCKSNFSGKIGSESNFQLGFLP